MSALWVHIHDLWRADSSGVLNANSMECLFGYFINRALIMNFRCNQLCLQKDSKFGIPCSVITQWLCYIKLLIKYFHRFLHCFKLLLAFRKQDRNTPNGHEARGTESSAKSTGAIRSGSEQMCFLPHPLVLKPAGEV